MSRFGVAKFLKHYKENGSITRKPGSGRPSKITMEIKQIVEEQMKKDDETTAYQLHSLLVAKGYNISLNTILRCRTSLGWTFRGSAYCQLIREVNKQKRLAWALQYQDDSFENVIWTDESTIQLENHRRYCCRKKGESAKPKPRYVCVNANKMLFSILNHYITHTYLRPKHPVKVHVWAGISKQGRTGICIFDGTMDRFLFVDILEKTLVPFISEKFTEEEHRFMQDNDPKHTSVHARNFLETHNINWWKTPAESPDLNPIENLWHELKEYIRREVKPKTKEDLVRGILQFWDTVTVAKCTKYINHLNKVIPKVIDLQGSATGY